MAGRGKGIGGRIVNMHLTEKHPVNLDLYGSNSKETPAQRKKRIREENLCVAAVCAIFLLASVALVVFGVLVGS